MAATANTRAPRKRSGTHALHALGDQPDVNYFFVSVDTRIGAMLAELLAPLLSDDQVPHAVDCLRSAVDGVTLSALERPDRWPAARQLAVLATIVQAAGVRDRAPAGIVAT